MKKSIVKIGGMALFNGVLLKSIDTTVITSKYEDSIVVEIENNNNNSKLNFFSKIFIIRGFISLYNSIKTGIPYIMNSSKNIVKVLTGEEVKINKLEIILAYIVSFILLITTYIVFPNYISIFVPDQYMIYIQLLIKTIIFITYFRLIKNLKYLDELFEYHGAEHVVVNYYENNMEEVSNINNIIDFDLEKVSKYSKIHKRCGSNFVTYLFVLTLIVSGIFNNFDILTKPIIEIVVFPLLIGVSYEVLNILSVIPFNIKIFNFVQNITTKIPDLNKIEISCISLLGILKPSCSINELIKSYSDKYLSNLEINKNDILRIIAFVLNIDKDKLYLNDTEINLENQYLIKNYLNDYYLNNIPLQYILGEQQFFKECYIVNKNVLIPRADSEILVETAIKYINDNNYSTLIDMCTGSGAIGISIANNCNIENCILVDISKEALQVTNRNILKNNVNNKCSTMYSNLFENIENKVDVIVSNPPYISKKELLTLDKHVLNEPLIALDGGENGLDIYNRIIIDSINYLNENGYLILEIGYKQKEDLINLNINNGNKFEFLDCIKDLNNNDRVVVFRKRSE